MIATLGFWSGVAITVFFGLWFFISFLMMIEPFSPGLRRTGSFVFLAGIVVFALCLAARFGFYIGRSS